MKYAVLLYDDPAQWEGVDERTSPDNHLRTTLREEVECCKVLKHSDWIGGAEYGHGACETYAACSGCCRCEDNCRCGVEVFFAVVFPYSVYVKPYFVGVLDLLEHFAESVGRADCLACVGVGGCEAVYSDLHLCRLVFEFLVCDHYSLEGIRAVSDINLVAM